jgi:hypothetical protein
MGIRYEYCNKRHSYSFIDSADEGMTHWYLIFGLCGFKPRYKLVERIIKAHEHNQLARPRSQDLAYTARTRKIRPSQNQTRQGFNLPHLSVINLENNSETQPSHIKGWEGDPRTSLDTFSTSTQALESSRAHRPWLDPIYATAVNTTAVTAWQ